MAIINNRDKIQSEIASKNYKDGWDTIWGSKDDKDDGKIPICSKCSSCSNADNVCNCTCIQDDERHKRKQGKPGYQY